MGECGEEEGDKEARGDWRRMEGRGGVVKDTLPQTYIVFANDCHPDVLRQDLES